MKRPQITRRRLLITAVTVLLLYVGVGFLGVPLIIRHVVLPGLSDQGWLHGSARVESAGFNPFTFRVRLTNLELDDAAGDPLLRCGRLIADASLSTVWAEGYQLDELLVERPHVTITVDERDGRRWSNIDAALDFEMIGRFIKGLPRVAVERITVVDGSAEYHDLSLDEPVHQQVSDLTFSLEGFDTEPTNANSNRFAAGIGASGQVIWEGVTRFDPLTASGTLELIDVDLSRYSPYYEGAIEARVLTGRLTTKLHYEFAPIAAEPIISATIDGLRLEDLSATGRGMFRWHVTADELATGQIRADLLAATIDIQTVALDSPVAVALAERRQVEAPASEAVEGAAVTPPPGSSDVEVDDESAESDAPSSPIFQLDPPGGWSVVVHQLEVRQFDGLLAQELPDELVPAEAVTGALSDGLVRLVSLDRLGVAEAELGTRPIALRVAQVELIGPSVFVQIDEQRTVLLPKPTGESLPGVDAGATPPDAPPLAVIDKVVLEGGRVETRDLSLEQTGELVLADAGGEIGNVFTSGDGEVTLDLAASVGTGKGAIRGTINPFPATRKADLQLELDAMALESLDGYFRRFLGYELDSGAVAYTGHYRITGSQLDGDNRIVLEEFDLGTKTDSPDALNVPVKLGISLLRDPSGQVKLNVPVTGDMSDPHFRLGKVILQAFVNTFGRIATAPFEFLASSLGEEGADLSRVTFEPGSAEPPQSETAKLEMLAKALADRPALTLAVYGVTDPDADAAALRRAALRAELQEQIAMSLPKSDPMRAEPQRIVVTDAAYREAVLTRHAALEGIGATDQRPETEKDKLNVPILSDIVRGVGRVIEGKPKQSGENDARGGESIDASTGENAADAGPDNESEAVDFEAIEARVLASVVLPADALAALADRRARAAAKALVAKGVDAARVMIEPAPADADPAAAALFELR